MKRPTRSAAVGLAAALGLTAAVIPGVVAAQDDPGPVPFVSTLTLDTTSTEKQLKLEGAPTLDQTLTPAPAGPSNLNTCNLDTVPSLLAFKGFLGTDPTPAVGFKDNSLGVNERIASVCNRVDALSTTGKVETLEISLAPGIEVVNNVPVLGARSASLDIEVTSIRKLFSWQKAVVEAVATFTDGTQKKVELKQGSNGCAIPPTGSTSRMDGSNCRLDIEETRGKYFTKLTLTAKAGAFSLEGGSDISESPAAAPSTFELVTLVDAILECPKEGQLIEPIEIERDGVNLEYVGNADGTCEGFAVTLGVEEDGAVRFLKPLGVSPDAQFIFDVTWTKPNEGGSPAVDIPTAKIDFEFVEAEIFRDMDFCPTSVYAGGVLVGLPSGTSEAGIPAALGTDFEPDFPGFQYACLDQPRQVNISDGTVTVTDRIYLIGDARMRLG